MGYAHTISEQTKEMSTIIYPSPIFGPVHSRRLGLSLGINLQPGDGKICTFDCIYCECGFNADHRPHLRRPTRKEVHDGLHEVLIKLKEDGQRLDVLTFAGNGEPTAHPDFPDIIDDTIRLRDLLAPSAQVSVLSNATEIYRPEVRAALMRVDNNILKLDTVDAHYIHIVDRPAGTRYDVRQTIEDMKKFNGHLIIQSMFMKGTTTHGNVDNTGNRYVLPWLEAIRQIQPRKVMVYTIDRETPDPCLEKATTEELNRIRDLVIAAGIPCIASY